MITITHVMLFSSCIAIILSFLHGKTLSRLSGSKVFGLLFMALGISFLVTLSCLLLFPACEYLHLCAPSVAENIFHIAIPIVYFPIFWLAILLGYAFHGKKNA
jgi:hypothetical protein